MYNVVKHDRNNLVVPEAKVHIMAPATKQAKSAAYEAPALAVASLPVVQYEDLTQEQHPVTDWNIIILAIKAGRVDTENEYEEIKLRAYKKSVFSQVFTPRKKVKFAMEGATAGVQAVDLEASSEIRSLLKPRRPVSEGAVRLLTEQEPEAVCTYVQLLSMIRPELQEILFASKTALSERLMGVGDELGAALAYLGTGEGIPAGGGLLKDVARH
jgi:hypothetical protein